MILLSLMTILLLYMLVVFYRITKIYDYACYINNKIYRLNIKEIENGTYSMRTCNDRYARSHEMADRYPHFEYLIWRPVKSLYDMDYIINGRKE